MSYQPIGNYGVIGDLHTVALVGLDGSIDFYCAPRFDSPTVFAALLDEQRGGRFRIEPQLTGAHRKQLYLPDSNILLTRFLAEEGVAEISDFMTIDGERRHSHAMVRRVKTVRGSITYHLQCAPRLDYGRAHHRIEAHGREALFVPERGPAFCLNSSVPLRADGPDAVADFTLHAGESAWFVFEVAHTGLQACAKTEHYVAQAFKKTMNFWRRWVARSKYQGRWREMVNRSALVLKLITSHEHGSLVAAPTFGLPEAIGGPRNWDYRYTWIRDSAFVVYALIRVGHDEEAIAFMRWIEARCHELEPDGALQIMYGLDGRHELPEEVLSHLSGYRRSSPVRIGNDACKQMQLDIYGELMDAVYLSNKFCEPISHDLWIQLIRLTDWVCRHWNEPDHGIWEVRGGMRHFLHSRLMCWVAVDRAVRLALKRSFPAPLDRWLRTRDEIYADIFHRFWDREQNSFVQCFDNHALDASTLLMPLVRFVAPTDPRWLSTLRALDAALTSDSLVQRYKIGSAAADGFESGEGTFNMCSFWYVECLSRAGDVDQARLYFEKMLGYANHLGLYAEELGPAGEQLGNFPQAFTHLALISAAYNLDVQLQRR